MPTLTEAEAVAKAAHDRYAAAVTAATDARTHATDLRERLRTGQGADVTADALAQAEQTAEHAALAMEGNRVGLAELQEAVKAARRDALCDEIVTTLPTLGDTVSEALDALSEALVTYAGRVGDFNLYATAAAARLNTVGAAGERVKVQRHCYPIVDRRISVGPLHGDRLLLAELLPALADLGAPSFLLTECKTVAQAAASIPTTH